jgi:hypothetical protein
VSTDDFIRALVLHDWPPTKVMAFKVGLALTKLSTRPGEPFKFTEHDGMFECAITHQEVLWSALTYLEEIGFISIQPGTPDRWDGSDWTQGKPTRVTLQVERDLPPTPLTSTYYLSEEIPTALYLDKEIPTDKHTVGRSLSTFFRGTLNSDFWTKTGGEPGPLGMLLVARVLLGQLPHRLSPKLVADNLGLSRQGARDVLKRTALTRSPGHYELDDNWIEARFGQHDSRYVLQRIKKNLERDQLQRPFNKQIVRNREIIQPA